MITSGLFNLLAITPEITTIVGNSIHLGSLRKNYTLPAVRFAEVTSTPIITNSGTAGLLYKRFQFDCFAAEYLDAAALRDALKGLLLDYSGTLAEGTTIYATLLKNEMDNPLEEGRGGYVFRSVLDFEFACDSTG